MTVTEHIRKRLLVNVLACNYWQKADGSEKLPALASLRKSEWVPEFEDKMRNRLLMGTFRYELMVKKEKSFKYDCATAAIDRLKLFISTGNTEHLVDAANMCMLEFKYSNHPNKHFSSIDDGAHAIKKGV